MDTVKIGIIGCGGRMDMLLDMLLINERPLELAAFHDPDRSRCERFKEKFKVPEAPIYDSYQKLVQDPKLDWVMIGSWNCFHKEQIVAALNAGKNVFCEKPIAISLSQCAAIKRAHDKSGKKLMLGFTLRYSPHYRRIKKTIDDGAIGRLVSMEFNETLEFFHGGYIHSDWRRLQKNAGSHVLEKCCHDLDLVNWMVGAPVVKAASFGGLNFFTPENAHRMEQVARDSTGSKVYTSWPGSSGMDPFNSDKDITDNQVAILEFSSGVRSTFHTNCNVAVAERRMYICGTLGTIRSDVLTGTIELKKIGSTENMKDISTVAKGIHGNGDPVLTEHLSDIMTTSMEPMTSVEEGIRSAVVAFGIDKAFNTNKVVDIRPMWARAGIEI